VIDLWSAAIHRRFLCRAKLENGSRPERKAAMNRRTPKLSPAMKSSNHILVLFLLAGTLTAGCGHSGPERYEVSGSVSFAGEKVAEGAVAFVPIGDTKGPKVGGNIQQGQYHIERSGGPVAGRHRVEITCIRKTGRQIDAGGRKIEQMVNVLPAK